MKLRKRLLASLLVFALITACFPIGAFAAEEDVIAYPVEGGNIYFDPTTGTVTDADKVITAADIPAEINGVAVTSIGDCVFLFCYDLISVTIPSSVTSIGQQAFQICKNLPNIVIPDSVTSIGAYALWGCDSLTSIVIPDSVTSIGEDAFYACTNLTSIVVSGNLTSIESGAFFRCSSITSIVIPDSVTSIESYAFGWCVGLTSIIIPDSVTSIDENAFKECDNLTSITIQNPDCSIAMYESTLGDSEVTVIYGYTDSTAQTYAEEFGYQFVAIDEPAHEHTTEIQNAVEATCTEAGYTGDEVCTECGETLNTGSEIPAKGHTWGDWISNKDATTESDGTKTHTCSVCGETETVTDTGSKLPAPTEPDPAEPEPTEPKPTEPTPTDPEPTPSTPTVTNPFTDLKSGAYYVGSVLWAYQEGITAGTSASTFSPEQGCTRAQVVSFLWRAVGSPKPTSSSNPFTDIKAGSYYYDAVLWAAEKGITAGTSATTFSPNARVTRGQFVTFLYRFAGSLDVSGAQNPFTDLNVTTFYYSAVLWAAEKGITAGTSAVTFSPEATCTRGQVVTFLYRYFN